MPIPVQQYILSFACLCDMQESDKRVSHLRETLEGLEKALEFYLDNYLSEVYLDAYLDRVNSVYLMICICLIFGSI